MDLEAAAFAEDDSLADAEHIPETGCAWLASEETRRTRRRWAEGCRARCGVQHSEVMVHAESEHGWHCEYANLGCFGLGVLPHDWQWQRHRETTCLEPSL